MNPSKLASALARYTLFYELGEPLISDAEYDALEKKLRDQDPKHPFLLKQVGQLSHKLGQKVRHPHPLLSLAKVFTEDDLKKFLKKHPDQVLMDKIDGMAVQFLYDQKGQFQSATTRGDGQWGEDVSPQISFIPSLPHYLDCQQFSIQHSLILKGEVFFPLHLFEEYPEFDSPRNALVGAFSRKDLKESSKIIQKFEIQIYDAFYLDPDQNIRPLQETFWEKLSQLEKAGFSCGQKTGWSEKILFTDTFDLNHLLKKKMKEKRPYARDGLVFRVNSEATWWEWGQTAHHPRGSLAWKPPSQTGTSTIKAITFDVSRHGKLTFRAEIEPCRLSGAVLKFASLYSAQFIQKKQFSPGDQVSLTRSGDVIPKIINRLIPASENYQLPSHCLCNQPVLWKGSDLYCPNFCWRQAQAQTIHYVQSLEVHALGKARIKKLFQEKKITGPSDLYEMKQEDWLALEGFEENLARSLQESISATSKQTLPQFLRAIGIPGIGQTKAQQLAEIYSDMKNLLEQFPEKLDETPGWGAQSIQIIQEGLKKHEKEIKKLLKWVSIVPMNENQPLKRWKVVITGKFSLSRQQWTDFLKEQGAQVNSQVTNKTTHLLQGESNSPSKKTQRAIKLKIPIYTEETLRKELLKLGLNPNP